MRIHTNDLKWDDLHAAAKAADVQMERSTEHGSRSHNRAFDVILSGNSGRRANFGGDHQAATWDQWGIFLGHLFNKEAGIKAGDYKDANDFHMKTCGRFESEVIDDLDPTSSHSHKWEYTGVPRQFACKSSDCTAEVRHQ